MDVGATEIGPIISEAEASKTPERRYSRGEVLQAFNSTLDLLNGIPKDQLTPKEQADIDLVNEIKGKTIDKGRASYVNRFKDEKGNEYSQREQIPIESLINFLNVKIESGQLSEDEKKDYEERRRIIARHSKHFYDLPHRLEASRLNARIHQEFERVQKDSRLDIGNWKASDLITDRRELILPREKKDEDKKEEDKDEKKDEDKKGDQDKREEREEKKEDKKDEEREEEEKEEKKDEEETVQQIRMDIAITNRTTDPRKRAAELAEELLHSEMRRGSILNPLNWGRKVGLRIMEEYWRQRLIKQVETSMLENNNSLLTLDMAKSAIRARDIFRGNIQNVNLDVNANKAKEQVEGQDTNKQLRLGAQENSLISGQRVEEAQGVLRNMMIGEIIRPLVEGKITDVQIQDKLREFVRVHQGDPQVLAIFGPDANQYGRIATYFATDLKEATQVIKDDIAAHKYAIEQLNEVVRIQLANTDWAAETTANFTRADRAIAWAERHRLSGLLANPAIIGAAFSLGTFATLRATGVAAKASQWIVPGVGLLPAAAFAAYRRNYDLKVDRASHQVERTYNMQIPPEAKRREVLEKHAYNTASVDNMINGGGQEMVGGDTRLSMKDLLVADLLITSNREALIRRITEMKSRLDFSAEESIDLVTFESREKVSQGRLQLIEAIAQAHIAFRNAGVKNDVITREEGILTGEWRTKFTQNRKQQDKSFAIYRLKQSALAGAIGGVTGLAGGLVAQEALAGIGRGLFGQQIGNTAIENLFSGKSLGEKLGGVADTLNGRKTRELYDKPGHVKTANGLTMDVGKDHAASFYDTSSKKIPTPPIHVTEEGKLVFSGTPDKLPAQIKDLVGGWENQVNTNPALNLHEHLQQAAAAAPGAGHETFQHGDWVIDINSGPNHQMSMTHWPTQTQIHGFIGSNGALDIDSSFGGNSPVTPGEWEDMQKLLTANGWATSSETVPGKSLFGPEGEWKNFSTNVDHREWYSYDRPGSQQNELRLHDFKDGSKVILDMTNMQQGFQRGLNPNPIDVQEVIKNREGGFYFTTPDLPQDGIWVPDGTDGVWDGKLALDPGDIDPTHIIQTSKGPLQLGEFSKMVLNQEALQKYPDGNLATEVFDRQDVFNLGKDGQNGFIESGRIIQKDGVNILQDFATIRGISEAQPAIPKEVFTFKPPIATEFTPPAELEPPPIIPIPFVPRYPLEPLTSPLDEGIRRRAADQERTLDQQSSLIDQVNRRLTESADPQVSFETTPQTVARATQRELESFVHTTNLRNPGAKVDVKVQGNKIILEGNINSMEGTSRFSQEYIPSQNGQLTPLSTPYVNITDKMADKLRRESLSELRKQIYAITLSFPPQQIKQQVNLAWETSGARLENGKIVLDFQRKGTPAMMATTLRLTTEPIRLETAGPESLKTLVASRAGVAETIGRRRKMEDAHTAVEDFGGNPDQSFFAIYDGHGGNGGADFAARRLHENLLDQLTQGEDPKEALRLSYIFTDVDMEQAAVSGGTTAITAFIKGDRMYVANAGDARAVLNRDGRALRLSHDHKADDEEEKRRIEIGGGKVTPATADDVARVNDSLAIARALGDSREDPLIIPDPYIREEKLAPGDNFLILACDGVWDVISDQEAVDLIKNEPDIQKAAEILKNRALEKGSTDNISVMVINLSPTPEPLRVTADEILGITQAAEPIRIKFTQEEIDMDKREMEAGSTIDRHTQRLQRITPETTKDITNQELREAYDEFFNAKKESKEYEISLGTTPPDGAEEKAKRVVNDLISIEVKDAVVNNLNIPELLLVQTVTNGLRDRITMHKEFVKNLTANSSKPEDLLDSVKLGETGDPIPDTIPDPALAKSEVFETNQPEMVLVKKNSDVQRGDRVNIVKGNQHYENLLVDGPGSGRGIWVRMPDGGFNLFFPEPGWETTIYKLITPPETPPKANVVKPAEGPAAQVPNALPITAPREEAAEPAEETIYDPSPEEEKKLALKYWEPFSEKDRETWTKENIANVIRSVAEKGEPLEFYGTSKDIDDDGKIIYAMERQVAREIGCELSPARYNSKENRWEAKVTKIKPEATFDAYHSADITLNTQENVGGSLESLEQFAHRDNLENKEVYERSLDNALKTLEGKDGIAELKDIPAIIIPDLHARKNFLVEVLNQQVKEGPYSGQKIFDLLKEGRVNIVCLGDGMHSEQRANWEPSRYATETDSNGRLVTKKDSLGNVVKTEYSKLLDQLPPGQQVNELRNKEMNRLISEEMARSLGMMKMIMDLKVRFPENFHYIRGNHDDIKEAISGFYKYANESADVRRWVTENFGSDFLDKWAKFEAAIPLMVKGKNFVASHASAEGAYSESQIRQKNDRGMIKDLLWTDNRGWEQAKQATVDKNLENLGMNPNEAFWIIGHRPVDTNEGRYREQFGKLIQINNPGKLVYAYVPNTRKFNPAQDIYTI